MRERSRIPFIRPLTGIGILIETVLGFAKVFFLWVLAVMWSPVFLLNVLAGRVGHALGLILVVLGGLGLWGLAQLVVKLLMPAARIQRPRTIKLLLAAGLGALGLFGYLLKISSAHEAVVVLLPAVVALHLAFVGRRYLWG